MFYVLFSLRNTRLHTSFIGTVDKPFGLTFKDTLIFFIPFKLHKIHIKLLKKHNRLYTAVVERLE